MPRFLQHQTNSAATSLGVTVPRYLQAKLAISQPGDALEQQADQAAERVMQMPVPSRQAPHAEHPFGHGETIDRKSDAASGAHTDAHTADVLDQSSAARPLDQATRTHFETRFGHDFGGVRVHADQAAGESAQAVHALAYTVGRDIVFGVGQYAPATETGRRLLAHELTHVVQQTGNDAHGKGHDANHPGHSGIAIQRQPQPNGADAATQEHLLSDKDKDAIVNGEYADKGAYTLQTSTRSVKEAVSQWKRGTKVTTEVEGNETVIQSTFANGTLERAKQYLDAHWAGGIDVGKASGGGGDTKGKHIDMPSWVYDYQNKLAAQKPRDYVAKSWEKGTNPSWNADSFLAQRVLEAFLRAWHKKELPAEKAVASNVEELYKRAGVSEQAFGNAQAQLLGDPNVYGWCGPATYNAVVLGLMKHGLRFATGKEPVTAATIERESKPQALFIRNSIKWKNKAISDAELDEKYKAELAKMAFMREVNSQAQFFIATNTKKVSGWLKGDRFVSGADAYAKYELKPGDVITQALMNGSPVSGHVLTVIKEERVPDFKGEPGTAVSTIYGISGNAGSIGGGSVKIEKFTREMPPATLASDLNAMSSLGNRMTVAVDERKKEEGVVRARLATEQGVAAHKVSKADVDKGADAAQITKRGNLQAQLAKAKADFQTSAGMSYDDYVKAKNVKTPPLNIVLIGRNQKDLLASIARLVAQIRAIDDLHAVPVEAQAKDVAYSPSDPRYAEKSGRTGRFRPESIGSMWITTIIKASEYADAQKINADLNLDVASREKRIKDLGWDETMSLEEFRKKVLEKHGTEQLSAPVDTLWPGAIAAIEGGGLAKDYR